jgi:hypothetical protein
MIQEASKVEVEHPAHLLDVYPCRQRIERLVLAPPRPNPIREVEEFRFVDGIEHLDHR